MDARPAIPPKRNEEPVACPPFCIRPDPDGACSLCRRRLRFTAVSGPRMASNWMVISRHADLEGAERRLRHVCGPKLHDDEHGRITGAPPPEPCDERRG